MAERSLRGMRLGAQSFQSEEGVSFSPRRRSTYRAADGTTFDVMFAAEAELPATWSDPRTGVEGRLVDEETGELVEEEVAPEKAVRTHWDMLLERRTRAELEELLQERLQVLRARRGQDRIGA